MTKSLGYNDVESPNGYPGCPDAPWWFHMRHFFRITGYYDLEGIDENGNPKFTKLAHNVKLAYNKDAESWVINNDGTNMAFAVSNAASPVPIPIQNIAASLYKDEKHNYETCLYYDQNFNIAKEFLKETHPNLKIPDAGFYLWLPVKDDLKATIDLWRDYSVRVMPGTFMAENVSGENPCKGFLRIALVHKKEIVTEAIQRISNYFKNNHV